MLQSVIERLPGALAPEDATVLAAAGAPLRELPEVPGVVAVPGSGPHAVDYKPAGGPLSSYFVCFPTSRKDGLLVGIPIY